MTDACYPEPQGFRASVQPEEVKHCQRCDVRIYGLSYVVTPAGFKRLQLELCRSCAALPWLKGPKVWSR